MNQLFQWLVSAFTMLVLTASAQAAPKVLLLHTDEATTDGTTIVSNAIAEFPGAAVQGALNTPGTVTEETFTAANGGPFDVVVVVSVYLAPDASNMAAIQNAAAARDFSSLVLFMDTCQVCSSSNRTQLLATINGLAPFTVATGSYNSSEYNFPLNTLSGYANSFAALNPLRSNRFYPFTNIPADHALYLREGATPTDSGNVGAHTLIVPGSLSNGGAGACLIATSDASQFSTSLYPDNQGKLGAAILAALGTDASCRVAPVSTPLLAQPVPASSGWALAFMGLLLASAAALHLQSRRFSH